MLPITSPPTTFAGRSNGGRPAFSCPSCGADLEARRPLPAVRPEGQASITSYNSPFGAKALEGSRRGNRTRAAVRERGRSTHSRILRRASRAAAPDGGQVRLRTVHATYEAMARELGLRPRSYRWIRRNVAILTPDFEAVPVRGRRGGWRIALRKRKIQEGVAADG